MLSHEIHAPHVFYKNLNLIAVCARISTDNQQVHKLNFQFSTIFQLGVRIFNWYSLMSGSFHGHLHK